MIDLFLGVELEDTRRLLSEFDTLLDNNFPVYPSDRDNKYLIRFPDYQQWIEILYTSKGGGVLQKIEDVKFSLCTENGGMWRELTEREQHDLRLGWDETYRGTTEITYKVQLWLPPEPILDIFIGGNYFKNYPLSDLQKAIDNPKDTRFCGGISRLIFHTVKGVSYDMIFDMYRKGYLKLTKEQLDWWNNVKSLGL